MVYTQRPTWQIKVSSDATLNKPRVHSVDVVRIIKYERDFNCTVELLGVRRVNMNRGNFSNIIPRSDWHAEVNFRHKNEPLHL